MKIVNTEKSILLTSSFQTLLEYLQMKKKSKM